MAMAKASAGILFSLAAIPAEAAQQCCWSKWGDASSCGGYPSSGSGGLCNNDYKTKCTGNGDCADIPPAPAPTPAPSPTPPSPTPPSPGPPTPAPSPPAPYPGPPVPPHPPAPPAPPLPTKNTPEFLGWFENWGPDIKWWDNNMPGNCLMGCVNPEPFLDQIAPYSTINYGFAFLTKTPNPDQVGCGTKSPAGPCPEWDGENVYLGKAAMQGSIAVSAATTLEEASPSIIAIADVVRMARMHPSGPKRTKITLGGWSDYARIGSAENGVKLGKLMGKFVAYTFADGVDIDMEHLTPYSGYSDEFGAFIAFVTQMRSEFDQLSKDWAKNAQARSAALASQLQQLQPWQKKTVEPWFNTQINYLKEVAQNPPPHLEISWVTRFNAFLPKDNVFNYLMPDSPVPNATSHYETDNEGLKFWPQIAHITDTVNIMAYDAGSPAGPLKINFTTVLDNFAKYGNVTPSKVNMGFEPGEQAGAGVWEGAELDDAVAKAIKEKGTAGGVAQWAVNPSAQQHPKASVLCQSQAKAMNQILQPVFAYGSIPHYTKCGKDGLWPGNTTAEDTPYTIVV